MTYNLAQGQLCEVLTTTISFESPLLWYIVPCYDLQLHYSYVKKTKQIELFKDTNPNLNPKP